MRFLFLFVIVLSSCSSSKLLPSGQWSGYLSPMGIDDKRTLLTYQVEHIDEDVNLQIFGPRGMNMQAKELELVNDTLHFSFDKMDSSGSNSCSLKRVTKDYYYGRCTDDDGRWAIFAMQHNSINYHSGGTQIGGCPCHPAVVSEE